MPKCQLCQREIRWIKTAVTGKSMPLDPDPVDVGGNIYIDHDIAYVLKKWETHDGPLYVSHFATCRARSKNRPASSTKLANPLEAVRRIRREIDEDRAASQAPEAG